LTAALHGSQKGKPFRRQRNVHLRLEELESRLAPALIINSGQEFKFNGTEPGSVVVRDNLSPPPLTTTLDVLGGSIGLGGGDLTVYDSSKVNVSGGAIGYGGGSLYGYNTSVVNVSGGSIAFAGNVNAHNSSVINL